MVPRTGRGRGDAQGFLPPPDWSLDISNRPPPREPVIFHFPSGAAVRRSLGQYRLKRIEAGVCLVYGVGLSRYQ